MLTTKQIMDYMNEHVIGQEQAKHAIAIAHRERSLKVMYVAKDKRWDAVIPNNILMMGSSGVGKAQPLTAKLKTPTGWVLMGDVQMGQLLQMPDGSVAPVMGIYPQGMRNVYEVTFRDYRKTLVDGEHLWATTSMSSNQKRDFIRNTNEIAKLIENGNRVWVPLIKPYPGTHMHMPIDPYLLGVLLGDGSFIDRLASIIIPDDFIKDEITPMIPDGVVLKRVSHGKNSTDKFYHISGEVNGKENIFTTKLKEIGVFGKYAWEKSIPHEYMESSIEQRLSLLQGLMDTDGTACKDGHPSFATTSRVMAEQVCMLVRSMGWLANIQTRAAYTTKLANTNGKETHARESYVVSITADRPTLLFRLPRKKERCSDFGTNRTDLKLRVRSIRFVGQRACQCIMVNHPDHLYITDDYIVTHNTQTAKALAGLTGAPMVKIEITGYTQVGYYGRDVSTIMSDLLKEAIRIAPKIWAEEQKEQSSSFSNKEMDKLKPVYYAETALFANHLKVDPEKFTWDHFVTAYTSGKLNKLNVLYKYRIDLLTAEHDKGNKKTLDSLDDSDDVTDETKDIIQSMGIDFGNFFAGGKSINIYIREMVEMLSPVDVKQPKHVEVLSKTFDNKTLNKILTRISNNAVGRRRLTAFFTGMAPDQLKAWCDKLAMSFTISVASLLKAKTKLPGRSGSDVPKEFIIKLIEERGIIFIDEFDKIFLDKDGGNVGNIGVVRDLMPYLDGITVDVSTKGERETGGFFGGNNETYRINTANILFIVAGAFQLAKVEDVPAEILGRLPVHVKLKSLTVDDLVKVIKKPHGSELTRMQLMMDAEGVDFQIDDDAIKAIAELVFACNRKGEDLGARRVIGVMHVLFDRYKFDASNGKDVQVVVTRKYIESMSPTVLADVIDRPDVNDKPQTVTLELPKQLIKPQPKPKSKPE